MRVAFDRRQNLDLVVRAQLREQLANVRLVSGLAPPQLIRVKEDPHVRPGALSASASMIAIVCHAGWVRMRIAWFSGPIAEPTRKKVNVRGGPTSDE